MTFAEAHTTCPKCGATPAASACPKCGLATDKMEAFAHKLDEDVPADVRAAWDALAIAWDDDARHAAFMRVVVDGNAFAWAAQQYRAKKPDPRAEMMLARVRKAAEARLVASASARPAPKTVFHSVKLLLGGAVLMVVALLLILQFLKGKQQAEKPVKAPTQKVR
ncbi:MAG: hypothetical protein ACKV2T_41985 [Kofleriaceae bacterium]